MSDFFGEANSDIRTVIAARYAGLPEGTLRSVDFATIIDAISEGEIELSATAHKNSITDINSGAYVNSFFKDVFLNKQSVLQQDANVNNPSPSDFNYQDVILKYVRGTANQPSLPAAKIQQNQLQNPPFGDIGQVVNFPVGGTVTPRSVIITNTDIDALNVKVTFDQFFKINTETGDRENVSVRVLIKVNPSNGGVHTFVNEVVTGKSFASYSRDYGITFSNYPNFNANGFFPVTVSLERANDEGDNNTFNTMRLGGVSTIIFENNNYPHVACTSLRLNSEVFPNMPSRVFRIRGKKVKIPNNASVDLVNGRLTYVGNWNGTFATDKKWCSDPAFILFDLLTDTRSGCGLPEDSVDKFAIQKLSAYCSQLVSDGQGGQEPRFSLNVNIASSVDAQKLVKDICSVMRATPFYSEGQIKFAQDRPQNINDLSVQEFDYVFNNSNVIDGAFTYQGSSLKTRFNVINISYFDLDNFAIDYVTVKDSSAITRYGEKVKTIKTFGTTSRGQAQRVGKWFLFNQNETGQVCTFSTNIAAGAVLSIGDIVGIADRVKSATRRGGLVKAATNVKVTLDDSGGTNYPDIGDSPTISCILPDGTVETKPITSYTNVVEANVSDNFSSVPVVNSPYILESGSLKAQVFKVTGIKENKDKTYTISCIEHQYTKYSAIEQPTPLPDRNISLLTARLPAPSGVTATESIVVINNRAVPKLYIDWQDVEGASAYFLQYKFETDNFTSINTQQSEVEILNVRGGLYDIRIFTVNAVGELSSSPVEVQLTAKADEAPPEQPTDFEIEPINNYQVRLSWTQTTSLDVKFGGTCIIRHSPNSLAQTTFSNSIDLDTSNGNTTEITVPALTGTYSLKFKDLGNRFSSAEAKVELTLPRPQDEIQLKKANGTDFREQTAFSGTKTNVSVVSGALELTNPANNLTGTYDFASVFDLGGVFTDLRLERHIKSEGFNINANFDSIPNLDLRTNFDGDAVDRLKGRLTVATTNDNPSSSPTFTSFQNLTNGSFSGRAFKFRSNLISVDTNENIKFQELGFDAFLPARAENKYQQGGVGGAIKSIPLQSGTNSGGFNVVFAKPFFTGTSDVGGSTTEFTPYIGISTYDLPLGGTYVLSNVTGTGFTILFKNSSDSPTDVKFSFQALGYGKGA